MDKLGKISIAATEDEAAIRIIQRTQPTIPASIDKYVLKDTYLLKAVRDAVKVNREEADTDGIGLNKEETSGSTDIMRSHSRAVMAGQLSASRKIDGIKRRQREIAKQLAFANVHRNASEEENPTSKIGTDMSPDKTVSEKIKSRLAELEQISRDIDQNIAHIDAVVAIKKNYLHQLRTAEKLLERYTAEQETASSDEDTDQYEVFKAAYTIIMHNVPRRYNPEASNTKGHETIAQVIERLEEEVADLNAKATEERFEVKMEETLLSSLVNTKNIKQVEYMLSHNQAMEFESLCDVILKTIIDTSMKTFPWSEMRKSENGLADIERMQQIKRNVIQRLINSLDIPRKTGDKEPDPIVVGLDSVVLDWNAKIDEGSPKENQEPLDQNTKTRTAASETPPSSQEETYTFDFKNFKL